MESTKINVLLLVQFGICDSYTAEICVPISMEIIYRRVFCIKTHTGSSKLVSSLDNQPDSLVNA